jgi:para-aminobenzoate synthetase component 2
VSGTRVLVIDNYDSFVFNLVQYLAQLGAEVVVRRNDEVTIADIEALGVGGILLSPGPGRPEDAGVCVEVIRSFAGRVPVLGVCLGHQAIAVAYGGKVVRAPELLHGKTSLVQHRGDGVLRGLPNPFTATRYHSLSVEDLPDELRVTATTDSGVVMAMRHVSVSVEGVQFHPESVLTEGGHQLLANWLTECGDTEAPDRVPALAEQLERQRASTG